MSRRSRIALLIVAVPVVLAALLWGALLTLGNTEWGRQRIALLVATLTSNQVRLYGLGGELPSHLTLAKLELADRQGIWLTAHNLQATWHPWALLTQRVSVDNVHAQAIEWLRLPVSSGQKSSGQHGIPHIDVRDLSIDSVTVTAALAGLPATLNLHGSAHLRSLTDMQMTVAATRLDGEGTYSVQLAFNEKRMDGAFRLREPAHGPLAGLLGLTGIGPVQVAGDLAGPRAAEKIDLTADVGDLHAHTIGAVDLVHLSADLDYAIDAPAMTPRTDLAWQQLHMRGNWHGPAATAMAAAELEVRALHLPDAITVQSIDASLTAKGGDLSVHGRIEGATVPGLPLAALAGAPLLVDGSIRLGAAMRPFELNISHPAVSAHTKGQAAGTLSVIGDVELANVAPFLQALPIALNGPLRLHANVERVKSALQMRVTASGNLDSSDASVHQWMRGPETADIRATYQPGELILGDSTLANTALNVTATGKLTTPKNSAAWSIAARTRVAAADLSALLPSLAGHAAVRADLSGTFAALRVTGDLAASVAVHGSAPGDLAGTFGVTDLPRAPHATINVHGALAAQPLTLQADVQIHPHQDVHIVLPRAEWQSLHAQGDLTLAQDLDRSRGTLTWSLANLADLNELLGQHLSGKLAGALNLLPAAGDSDVASTALQVHAEGIQVGVQKLNATLTGTGPLHALQLNFAADTTVLDKPASVAVEASLDAQQQLLTLKSAKGTVHTVDLRLDRPAQVAFAHGLSISNLHLVAADAQLQAGGQILPQLQVSAHLSDATPGLINEILPGYLASGSLDATVQLHGTLAHPLGQLRLTGKDFRAAGDAASLPPAQLSASVDVDNDGAKVALHSSAGETSHMTVDGTIPWSGSIAVTASGKLDLPRLNPLLESSGRRINGTVDVNAQVAGTVATPTVKGTVMLHQGAVHDYRHGIDLTNIEGELDGTQDQLRIKQLTAHAATGSLAVTGTLGVLQGGWPVELHFTANEAQPFASSIISGSLNADLALTGTLLHEMSLAGTVRVNRATVEIPNNFPPNVAVLDVRRPGEVVAPPSTGPTINLKVAVNAPRQILVRGRGLDAELGGNIQIGGTARSPTADGGFDLIRGLFTLAGSRLTFSSGRVSFTGTDVTGKIDPTLDFTAQTTAVDTTVTLRITGVADAPQFELTSVPQLPQDEILARLLFGESAGQLTALQAAQLGAALVTLTGVGTGLNPLVEIQKHLGLDRLAVGSNDTGTPGSTQNSGATIEAGRYVTNRIFVDVKQNTTGATQLQVDVDLTNKLKLQTRIGTGTATVQGTTPDNDPGSSVGLSYRFEY